MGITMHHDAPAVMRNQDHGVVSKPNHIDKERPVTSPVGSGMGRTRQNTAAPRAPRPAQASRAEVIQGQARQELPSPAIASQKPRPPRSDARHPAPFIAVPRQDAWPFSSSCLISAEFNSRTIKYGPQERVAPGRTFCSSG